MGLKNLYVIKCQFYQNYLIKNTNIYTFRFSMDKLTRARIPASYATENVTKKKD